MSETVRSILYSQDAITAEAETICARQVILQAAETLGERITSRSFAFADLLAEAHMSKSYFLRLFRRYMGTTPYNYRQLPHHTGKGTACPHRPQRRRNCTEGRLWGCQQFFHPLCKSHRQSPSAPQKCAEAAGGHKVNKGS